MVEISTTTAENIFHIGLSIRYSISAIALVVNLGTMLLMLKMKVYANRLMALAFCINFVQIFYDIGILPLCGNDPHSGSYFQCRSITIPLIVSSALIVSQCGVAISCLVCYVIVTRKQAQMPLWLIISIVVAPAVTIGTLIGVEYYKTHVVDSNLSKEKLNVLIQVYDIAGLINSFVNIVAISRVIYELRQLGYRGGTGACWQAKLNICLSGCDNTSSNENTTYGRSSIMMRSSTIIRPSHSSKASRERAATTTTTSSQNSKCSKKEVPLFLLAERLKWYPIMGSLSAVASALYHISTNSSFDSFVKTATKSDHVPGIVPLFFVYAILLPFCGIGYGVAFLIVQPGAWTQLKASIFYAFCYARYCGSIPSGIMISDHTNPKVDKGGGGDTDIRGSTMKKENKPKFIRTISKKIILDGSVVTTRISTTSTLDYIPSKLDLHLDSDYLGNTENIGSLNDFNNATFNMGVITNNPLNSAVAAIDYEYDYNDQADGQGQGLGNHEDEEITIDEYWDYDHIEDLESYIHQSSLEPQAPAVIEVTVLPPSQLPEAKDTRES